MVCTTFPRAPLVSVPEDLPAQYRGADEDWKGERGFRFVRWLTPPSLATDGTVIPGQPRDLTGCSCRGLLYQRHLFERFPLGSPVQAPDPLNGVIDEPLSGVFAVEMAEADVLRLMTQDRYDPRSRYILRVLLSDPSGVEGWLATVPVFVL